jgi:hypothetical protein
MLGLLHLIGGVVLGFSFPDAAAIALDCLNFPKHVLEERVGPVGLETGLVYAALRVLVKT